MRILLAALCCASLPAAGQISCGDCNTDGAVATVLDALLAAQMGAGLTAPTLDQECACDVDASSTVTILDALLVAQSAAGLPATLGCAQPYCGNAPPVTLITDPTSGTRVGFVLITFDTTDLDGDPLDLVFEYSDGGPFVPAGATGSGTIKTNPALGTAPALAQTFVWDSVGDGVGRTTPTAISFRVTATDPSTASSADTVSFTVDNVTPTTWVELFPAVKPVERYGHKMAYDPVAQMVVLFGGRDSGGSSLADTWEWDGANWTQRFPPVSPSARYRFGMAHDRGRGFTVLYGGDPLNDETWEWDGATWAQRFPATRPVGRTMARLVYDDAIGEILCFGGNRGSVYYDETWAWDGLTWTQLASTTRPTERLGVGIEHDRARGETLLHGGYIFSGGPVTHDDTWVLVSGIWSEVFPATVPTGRWSHTLTYDPARGIMIMACGTTTGTATGGVDETWEWDGADWTLLAPTVSPPARIYHAAAFDEARGKHFLFGGALQTGGQSNDCWIY